MGIPYYPQGQAIVDRAHQTLKIQIQKLKEGEFKCSPPPSDLTTCSLCNK